MTGVDVVSQTLGKSSSLLSGQIDMLQTVRNVKSLMIPSYMIELRA